MSSPTATTHEHPHPLDAETLDLIHATVDAYDRSYTASRPHHARAHRPAAIVRAISIRARDRAATWPDYAGGNDNRLAMTVNLIESHPDAAEIWRAVAAVLAVRCARAAAEGGTRE